MDDFDREFQLIFENALIFNEDGSRINKDARVLLKLFNTRKKDIYSSYKLVDNPKASAVDKVIIGEVVFTVDLHAVTMSISLTNAYRSHSVNRVTDKRCQIMQKTTSLFRKENSSN